MQLRLSCRGTFFLFFSGDSYPQPLCRRAHVHIDRSRPAVCSMFFSRFFSSVRRTSFRRNICLQCPLIAAKTSSPPIPAPASPPSTLKLEIANRGRYGTGAGGGAASRNAVNGGCATPGRTNNGGGIGSGSRTRSPSPRKAGSVTLAEAKEQLGPEFVILGERPVLSRAVAGGDQAMAALRECTKETDKGIGNAFSVNE